MMPLTTRVKASVSGIFTMADRARQLVEITIDPSALGLQADEDAQLSLIAYHAALLGELAWRMPDASVKCVLGPQGLGTGVRVLRDGEEDYAAQALVDVIVADVYENECWRVPAVEAAT